MHRSVLPTYGLFVVLQMQASGSRQHGRMYLPAAAQLLYLASHCKHPFIVAHEVTATHCTLGIISASTSHDSLTAGHAEDFSSLEEVVQCVRPGILLDAASVPSVHMTDRHGRVLPLNRYLLDYWGHCQKQALTLANGLREGDH